MRWDRGRDVIDGSRLSAMTRSVDEVEGWLRGRGHTGRDMGQGLCLRYKLCLLCGYYIYHSLCFKIWPDKEIGCMIEYRSWLLYLCCDLRRNWGQTEYCYRICQANFESSVLVPLVC